MNFNLKHQLSLLEKIFIIKHYYKSQENCGLVTDLFQNEFKVTISNLNVVSAIVDIFEKTGNLVSCNIVIEDYVPQHTVELSISETQLNVIADNFCKDEVLENTVKEETGFEEQSWTKKLDELIELPTPDNQATAENFSEDDVNNSSEDEGESSDEEKPAKVKRKYVNTKSQEIKQEEPPTEQGGCPICGKEFSKKKNLSRHIKTHLPEKNHICELCNKAFKNQTHLRNHKLSHMPLSERLHFECDICGKKVVGKEGLRKHRRIHTDSKDYVCEWCGKGFLKSTGLKLHVRIHTGEKPYQCTMCDKAFSTSGSRVIHMRVHTGERPYACNYCDKSFVDNSTRNVHHRQHTGENPYVCHLCGKSCKQAQNLRSHIRHAHTRENLDKPKFFKTV